jgi:hypothetical protein
MATFLLTRVDGGVSVLRLIEGKALEEELAKWPGELRSQIVATKEISEEELPKDRTFRDAWTASGVDMAKAREIWRGKIRLARQSVFAPLDADYMKAVEAGDEARKAEVVSKKQSLRDIPQDPRIEAAQTPEELKAVWPEELGPKDG